MGFTVVRWNVFAIGIVTGTVVLVALCIAIYIVLRIRRRQPVMAAPCNRVVLPPSHASTRGSWQVSVQNTPRKKSMMQADCETACPEETVCGQQREHISALAGTLTSDPAAEKGHRLAAVGPRQAWASSFPTVVPYQGSMNSPLLSGQPSLAAAGQLHLEPRLPGTCASACSDA